MKKEWSKPVAVEIDAGMEVNSYASSDLDDELLNNKERKTKASAK